MGGSTIGSTLGGIAGTLVAPGIGTVIGSGLGGLAGGGISSAMGGGGASTQPAAQPVSTNQGLFQSYTPQAQQQQDYTWQGLQNQLSNLAWSGLSSLPGGVTPATQLYPQVSGVAQGMAAPGTVAGSYGPYGDVALGKDLWSLGTLQDIYGGPQNLINYGQQAGAAGLSALPAVQQAAFSPQIGQTVQNVINNPYLQQQLAGAQAGANIGGQAAGLTPQQTQLLNALGGQLPGLGQQAAATTGAQIPLLQQLAGGSAATGQALSGQAAGLGAPLAQAQQQILQTGMDPQSALYNRTAQQVRDQQQAINAMSGVGTSPYGAGVTGQTMANFNIDWQNQQLQRQAQAAQAAQVLSSQQLAGLTGAGSLYNLGAQGAGTLAGQAGTLAGQGLQQQLNAAQAAGNLFTGGLSLGQGGSALAAQAGGLPAAAYQQQQQNALAALQAQNQAAGLGVQNLANLTSQLGAAGQQPIAGLTAANTLAQQPYNTAQTQAQNALSMLQNQATFGNQMLQLPQNVLANAQAYMTGGQNASQIGGLLGQQAFNQNMQQLAGIGALGQGLGLLGGGGGNNLLFGSGGLSGALGLDPTTGLLGGLGASSLTPAAAGAASGFGNAFGAGAIDLGTLFA